jgi:hypothetical protein
MGIVSTMPQADPSVALRVNVFTAPLDLLWAVSMEKGSMTDLVDQ